MGTAPKRRNMSSHWALALLAAACAASAFCFMAMTHWMALPSATCTIGVGQLLTEVSGLLTMVIALAMKVVRFVLDALAGRSAVFGFAFSCRVVSVVRWLLETCGCCLVLVAGKALRDRPWPAEESWHSEEYILLHRTLSCLVAAKLPICRLAAHWLQAAYVALQPASTPRKDLTVCRMVSPRRLSSLAAVLTQILPDPFGASRPSRLVSTHATNFPHVS